MTAFLVVAVWIAILAVFGFLMAAIWLGTAPQPPRPTARLTLAERWSVLRGIVSGQDGVVSGK